MQSNTKKISTIKPGLGRRGFLAAGGAGLLTAGLGAPSILRAQTDAIRVGMPTILSGRVSILGETASVGANMAVDAINEAGGVNGRQVELIIRNSMGKPDEAAKVARDLINSDGCDIILDAEATSGAFAIHEVVRDSSTYCMHCIGESSEMTADPAMREPWIFRSGRQGIHDAIAGGHYSAEMVKAGAKRWMSCSPDYAYGRSTTASFEEYLEKFAPEVEFVGATWPKIFQPDYTENINAILNSGPDALYSCLWGGDLVSFFDQASLYGLFQEMQAVCVNMGDTPVLEAIKNMPGGIVSGNRYHKDIPDIPSNEKWNENFRKSGKLPTNWAWQAYTGASFILAALADTNGDTDSAKLSDATRGRTIDSPFGVEGTVTMREEDNTLVDYAIAYGKTLPEPPYLGDAESVSWDLIREHETEWKKKNNFS